MSPKKIFLQEQCIHHTEKLCMHLAQELHDDIGQRMTVLLLALEQAPYTQEKCYRIATDLRAIHHDIRQLSNNLYPPILASAGLGASLRTLCASLTNLGLQAQCFIAENIPKLDKIRALNLYRIAQEALNNVLKHAHAQHVFISLTATQEHIILSVEDDGQGFALDTPQQGLGLSLMQERLTPWQGSCVITSSVDIGTVVMATLPNP